MIIYILTVHNSFKIAMKTFCMPFYAVMAKSLWNY